MKASYHHGPDLKALVYQRMSPVPQRAQPQHIRCTIPSSPPHTPLTSTPPDPTAPYSPSRPYTAFLPQQTSSASAASPPAGTATSNHRSTPSSHSYCSLPFPLGTCLSGSKPWKYCRSRACTLRGPVWSRNSWRWRRCIALWAGCWARCCWCCCHRVGLGVEVEEGARRMARASVRGSARGGRKARRRICGRRRGRRSQRCSRMSGLCCRCDAELTREVVVGDYSVEEGLKAAGEGRRGR